MAKINRFAEFSRVVFSPTECEQRKQFPFYPLTMIWFWMKTGPKVCMSKLPNLLRKCYIQKPNFSHG